MAKKNVCNKLRKNSFTSSEERFLNNCDLFVQDSGEGNIILCVENSELGNLYLLKEGRIHVNNKGKNNTTTVNITDKNIIKKLLNREVNVINVFISTQIRININDEEDLYEFNGKIVDNYRDMRDKFNVNKWMEIDSESQIFYFRKYLEAVDKFYGKLYRIPTTIKIIRNSGFVFSVNNELRYESLGIEMSAKRNNNVYISGYNDWRFIQPTTLFLLNKYVERWEKIGLRKLPLKPLEAGIFNNNKIVGICEPKLYNINVYKAPKLYKMLREKEFFNKNDNNYVPFAQINDLLVIDKIRDWQVERKNIYQDYIIIIADPRVKKGVAKLWYEDLCNSKLEVSKRLREEIKKKGIMGFAYLSGSSLNIRVAVPLNINLLCDYKILCKKIRVIDILLSEGFVKFISSLNEVLPATIYISKEMAELNDEEENYHIYNNEKIFIKLNNIFILRSLRGNRWVDK